MYYAPQALTPRPSTPFVVAAPTAKPEPEPPKPDNRVCAICGFTAGARLSGEPPVCSVCRNTGPHGRPFTSSEQTIAEQSAIGANLILDAISTLKTSDHR